MNNLLSEKRGLSNLPNIGPVPEPLRQRIGEGERLQETDLRSQTSVIRLEQLPQTGEVHRQFVITRLIGSATLPQPVIGLANALMGRSGLSACLPPLTVAVQPAAKRPLLYRKNGILVGHTGRTITAEDVANVLAEE